MMRMVFLILGLSAIGVGLVHLRRDSATVRYAIRCLESQHTALRRDVWDRQIQAGRLMAPRSVRHRAAVMALEMTYHAPVPQTACDERRTGK